MVNMNIIKLAQKGHRLSKLQLLKEIEGLVYRTAHYVLKNKDDAILAAQQALIEIYKTIHFYKETENFTMWIQRKVTTSCMEICKPIKST